jgi:hypothetical protein
MIPEKNRYHGSVLLELVNRSPKEVRLRSSLLQGRSRIYIVNETLGIFVRHSSSRLRPWHFMLNRSMVDRLKRLERELGYVFIALVCAMDGIVCLSLDELTIIALPRKSQRLWLRVDRRRRHLYSVFGSNGALAHKKPSGLDCLMEFL